MAWNWVFLKIIKDWSIFCVFNLYCIKKNHVHLLKLSAIVRKKCDSKWVGTSCGPQILKCNKSKEYLLLLNFKENVIVFA